MVEANSKRWVMLLLFAVFAVTLVAVPQGSAYAAECDGQWPDSASCNPAGANDSCDNRATVRHIWLTSDNVDLRYSSECRTVWTRWDATGNQDFVKTIRDTDGWWTKTTTSGAGLIWTQMVNDAGVTSHGCGTDQNGGWMGLWALTVCTGSW